MLFFDCDECYVSDPSGLHTLGCDINRGDLKEQLAEIEASDPDDHEKNRKKSKCHTRLASWSPKGRSVVGITVLDEGGAPTSDKEALAALKSHWEPVFNNVVGDRRAFGRFSRFVQKCPEGIEPLGRDEFRLICGVSTRSAPGPDGIGVHGLIKLVVKLLLILFTTAASRFLMVLMFLVGLISPP